MSFVTFVVEYVFATFVVRTSDRSLGIDDPTGACYRAAERALPRQEWRYHAAFYWAPCLIPVSRGDDPVAGVKK